MYKDDEMTFLDNLLAMVDAQLPDDHTVQYKENFKNNNTVKRGILIKSKSETIGTIFYVDSYYSSYLAGASYGEVLQAFMNHYYNNDDKIEFNVEEYKDFNRARRNIVYRLINKEKNAELLENVPHREYFDLAVTYHYMLELSPGNFGNILVNNEHLEMWGIDEEQLYKTAHKNTLFLLAPVLTDIADVIGDKFAPVSSMDSKGIMYVLYNEKKSFGAVCMLYPKLLFDISNTIGGDYFIIPSSIHELILVPRRYVADNEYLLKTIKEVNQTVLDAEEMLSDNAYFYDSDTQQISLITGQC